MSHLLTCMKSLGDQHPCTCGVPQPMLKDAPEVAASAQRTIGQTFDHVGGYWAGNDKLCPTFGSAEALRVYTVKMQRQAVQAAVGAEVPAGDSYKPIFWFGILVKCARVLNMPDDQPIPSGVLRAVDGMVEQRQADEATIDALHVELANLRNQLAGASQ